MAEFANELPPDVAQAVREHIAVCEMCGARSLALRKPYELLAALGQEPVPYVPDLRDSVREHARAGRLYRRTMRIAVTLGRGGTLGMTAIIGLFALVIFIVGGLVFTAGARSVSRSTNRLGGVPSAGKGIVLVQTDKLVTVTDAAGRQWPVAEVIAVDEQNGAVVRSLPATGGGMQAGQQSTLPIAVAVAADGKTIFEVTAPNSDHKQALVAFDTASGKLQFASPLTLPGGRALPGGRRADGLALAPDGSFAYVGLDTAHPAQGGVRVLVLNAATGDVARTLAPGFSTTVPMPPPPGSLPASAFPTAVPTLDTSALRVSLGARGQIIVSPDGKWLFDVLLLSDTHGAQGAVVRRIDTQSGNTAQELALTGDFTLSRMAMSVGGSAPQLYLVKSSPDAQCFVLDAGDMGPILLGDIALGGPASPEDVTFTGSLSASPLAGGSRLYVTQNASAANGQIVGHDLWLVDTQAMAVLSHRVDADAADAVLANSSSDTSGLTFILRNGQVLVISPDLTGKPTSWLSLSDRHPVVRLLATAS